MDMAMEMEMTIDSEIEALDTTDLEACLDWDSLVLDDCDKQTIKATIKTEWKKIKRDCTHSFRVETMLLAQVPNYKRALAKLSNRCLGVKPCIEEWDDLVLEGDCTFDNIVEELSDYLPQDCPHNAKTELELHFGTRDLRRTKRALSGMCGKAWDDAVEPSQFDEIDERFNNAFMNEYVAGDTFLNTETGTFDDTEEGNNIDEFRDEEATFTQMEGFSALSQCQSNSIMCCFGRDRQPNDNNGNCADPIEENCVDADPADNSNLCFAGSENTPYPGESEGDIHCHGLAWTDDKNDPSARLRFNNFFYVSLYDHMYTRGYVENMIDSAEVPMCGCVESMPPVSRADCTEIAADTTFTIKYGPFGLEAVMDEDYEFDFNSCEGINPTTGDDANNDLASYVYRLRKEEKLSEKKKNKIFKTLVGYADPNDNDNEESCTSAYERKTGLQYPAEE